MIVTVTLNPTVDRTFEVPDFAVGGVHQGRALYLIPDGKGVNLANVLSQLGCACRVAGFVGASESALYSDYFAHRARQGWASVDNHLLPVASRTRSNTTILDPTRRTETHIRDRGFAVKAEDRSALNAALKDVAGADDIVIFCGSLPVGFGPEDLVEAVASSRAGGARVFVDTSDEPLRAASAAHVSLIKPNLTELEFLVGRSLTTLADVFDAGCSLMGDGLQTVLVTLGSQGAVLCCPEGLWHVQHCLPRDRVVNTVGCGDAFLAGYAFQVSRAADAVDALCFAVACGSAAALAPHAGKLDVKALQRFRTEVTVHPAADRNHARLEVVR